MTLHSFHSYSNLDCLSSHFHSESTRSRQNDLSHHSSEHSWSRRYSYSPSVSIPLSNPLLIKEGERTREDHPQNVIDTVVTVACVHQSISGSMRDSESNSNNDLAPSSSHRIRHRICDVSTVNSFYQLIFPITVYSSLVSYLRAIFGRNLKEKRCGIEIVNIDYLDCQFFLSDINKCVEAAKSLTTTSLPSKIEELNEVQKVCVTMN